MSFILQSTITFAQNNCNTQLETPTTGFSITVNPVGTGGVLSVWLLLIPAAGLASGTIILPAGVNRFDQQWVSVSTTQQIVSLTVNGNGANVSGAPAAMAADASFRLRYNAATDTWYRCD